MTETYGRRPANVQLAQSRDRPPESAVDYSNHSAGRLPLTTCGVPGTKNPTEPPRRDHDESNQATTAGKRAPGKIVGGGDRIAGVGRLLHAPDTDSVVLGARTVPRLHRSLTKELDDARLTATDSHRDAPGGMCTSHKDEGCNVACFAGYSGWTGILCSAQVRLIIIQSIILDI